MILGSIRAAANWNNESKCDWMTFVFYCIVAQEDKCKGTKSEGNVTQLIMISLLFNVCIISDTVTVR